MYTEEQAREKVIYAGNWLVEKGLVSRTWGNVSARISDEEFVITPSGKAYDMLKPEDMVKVKISDCSYEGDVKPSSEKGIHAAAYSMRPECNFIIHTHQFYASALAAEELDTPFAPCAGYGLPGTDTLKKHVITSLKKHAGHKKFLLAKHGALLIGNDMEEAFDLSEMLETDCMAKFRERVPSMDNSDLGTIDCRKFATEKYPYVILQQDEYVAECCHAGLPVRPYIDDYAQIVGPVADVAENRTAAIKLGLKGRNAVLVKGIGAICTGKTMDDAEAVAQIVSKNCAASCYVRRSSPLKRSDALLQRIIYLTKYSKQKEA